jgi:hypothetical protein
MKVVAVALAAVVGLVPVFTQVSYAQALPEPVSVLPLGEELPDSGLLDAEGEAVWLGCLIIGLITGATSTAIYAVTATTISVKVAAYVFGIGFGGGTLGAWVAYMMM